jgi:DNA-binding HxlR family transcriptional regulator
MAIPQPRRKARGSHSGRPVMVLLDLLGRRMTMRILWELHRAGGPMTFRLLESAAETNPSVLNTRLKELRAARLVTHGQGGYAVSGEGRSLVRLLLPLHEWAEQWASRAEGPPVSRERVSALAQKAHTKGRA